MTTKKLQKISDREIARVLYSGISKVEAKLKKPNHPHFKAKTNLETGEIYINYDDRYPFDLERTTKDLTRHEINHHGAGQYAGCPRSVDLSTKAIYEPIYSVLSEKGFSRADIRYTENALEDSLLHCDLHQDTALNGITDFFRDNGEVSPKQKVGEFYSAHILLNTFLWGNKKQKRTLAKYLEQTPEVQETVRNFVHRLGLQNLRKDSVKNRERLREFLMDEKNWPEISKVYAEEFSRLMKPGYARPLPNDSGAGTKGREDEDDSDEGNEFQKQRESREYKLKRIDEGETDKTGIPKWIDKDEALKEIYRRKANSLLIRASGSSPQRSIPVVRLGSKPYDPARNSPAHVRPKLNLETGEIDLVIPRTTINFPLPSRPDNSGFPTNKWIIADCSGSMAHSLEGSSGNDSVIPWGNNSKYHSLVSSIFGHHKFLSASGLATGEIGLIVYSDEGNTRVARGISASEDLVIHPEFGLTYLDMDVVEREIKGKDNLVFTISDGDFDNWGDIQKRFLNFAERQKAFFHLQIGKDGSCVKDIRTRGLPVVPILRSTDLENILIDLTKSQRKLK